jgi:SnoaL-like domain
VSAPQPGSASSSGASSALSMVSSRSRAFISAVSMWQRSTVCLRKIDGEWTVTHQHSSVPFDGQSGRASLDLKP